MNAPARIEPPQNVYQRLNAARATFHATKLKKSGHNKFADYKYFELGDFLIPALQIFREHGLCAKISFTADLATMTIVNADEPTDWTEITSPMGSANLKGCHEVQNIGAVETYQRRYLWVAALEIVEHDALDATSGRDEGQSRKGAVSPQPSISDEQIAKLQQLIKATGANVKAICDYFKVESLNLLPADNFAEALDKLNAKLAQKVKAETDAKAKEPA